MSEHIKFSDHYNYNRDDIKKLEKEKNILTTEKDFFKLAAIEQNLPITVVEIELEIETKNILNILNKTKRSKDDK